MKPRFTIEEIVYWLTVAKVVSDVNADLINGTIKEIIHGDSPALYESEAWWRARTAREAVSIRRAAMQGHLTQWAEQRERQYTLIASLIREARRSVR